MCSRFPLYRLSTVQGRHVSAYIGLQPLALEGRTFLKRCRRVSQRGIFR